MQSGRLHRFNAAAGEESDVALLESECAEYVGAKYCLGLSLKIISVSWSLNERIVREYLLVGYICQEDVYERASTSS